MSIARECRQTLCSLSVDVSMSTILQYACKDNLPNRDIVPAKSAVVSAPNWPISACFKAVTQVHP